MSDEIEKIAENMNPMFNTEQEFHVITKNNKEDNFNVYTILSTSDKENIETMKKIKELINIPSKKGYLETIEDTFGIGFNILSIFSFSFIMFNLLYLFKEEDDNTNDDNDDDNDEVVEGFIIEDKPKFIQDYKDILMYIHLGFAGFHLLSLLYYFIINRGKKNVEQSGGLLGIPSFSESKDKVGQLAKDTAQRAIASKETASEWFGTQKENITSTKVRASEWFKDTGNNINASLTTMKGYDFKYDFKSSFIRIIKIAMHLILFVLHLKYIIDHSDIFNDIHLFRSL